MPGDTPERSPFEKPPTPHASVTLYFAAPADFPKRFPKLVDGVWFTTFAGKLRPTARQALQDAVWPGSRVYAINLELELGGTVELVTKPL